jgi:hypothetical protein
MAELTGELVRVGFLLTVWALGIWVGGAGVAAWVAWEKGREPVAWFVLAFFLSPLVALVALGPVPAHYMARRRAWSAPRSDRKRLKDPVVASARRANGAHLEDKRWDVVTSAATTTKRPW